MISRLLKQSLRHHSVRIGCCSGFWGDSNFAARQLIDYGDVNYLVGDYLSEITMSLLAKMQMKREDLGFAFDFVGQVTKIANLDDIMEKKIRIVTNAGGIFLIFRTTANFFLTTEKIKNPTLRIPLAAPE